MVSPVGSYIDELQAHQSSTVEVQQQKDVDEPLSEKRPRFTSDRRAMGPSPRGPGKLGYLLNGMDARNIWTLPGTEYCVRPGFTRVYEPLANEVIIGAKTVRSRKEDKTLNYILIHNTTPDPYTKIVIMDEEFNSLQSLRVGTGPEPRSIFSLAIVWRELVLSSPDFPTVAGIIDGGIDVAKKVNSTNVEALEIEIPRGICIDWQGACVIARGEALFVSENSAPRTYLGTSSATMPGKIYGLHVAPGGGLIVVTSNGTYGFGADAPQGDELLPIVDKISDYSATGYGQTVTYDGALYGLTRSGIKRIDAVREEIPLSDRVFVRSMDEMIDRPDYREGTLYAGDRGPIVAIRNGQQDAICMFDAYRGLRSWWTIEPPFPAWVAPSSSGEPLNDFRMVGVLNTREGDTLIVSRDGIYDISSNREGTGGGTDSRVYGSFAGRFETPPEASPTVRRITSISDNTGSPQQVALGGVRADAQTTPTNGIVFGIDSWVNAAASDPKKFQTRSLASRRFSFSSRTDDITIELSAKGPKSRIGLGDIVMGGQGKDRP